MANIKSAKKRIIQSQKRRLRNKTNISEVRTEIKKLLTLFAQNKDTELLLTQLRKVEKLIDKVASKGVIHKNKAARTKSRLTRRYNKIINTTKPNTTVTKSSEQAPAESELEYAPDSVATTVE